MAEFNRKAEPGIYPVLSKKPKKGVSWPKKPIRSVVKQITKVSTGTGIPLKKGY